MPAICSSRWKTASYSCWPQTKNCENRSELSWRQCLPYLLYMCQIRRGSISSLVNVSQFSHSCAFEFLFSIGFFDLLFFSTQFQCVLMNTVFFSLILFSLSLSLSVTACCYTLVQDESAVKDVLNVCPSIFSLSLSSRTTRTMTPIFSFEQTEDEKRPGNSTAM